MIIIGIDPGQHGGVAVYNGKAFGYTSMPLTCDKRVSIARLYGFLLGHQRADAVYIERAQAMPKQGVVSMFSYGREFGRVLGMLEVIYDYNKLHLIRPQEWQRVAYSGISGKGKERSIKACERLFPGQILTANERSRKPHDGIADAMLIAHYGFLIESRKQK